MGQPICIRRQTSSSSHFDSPEWCARTLTYRTWVYLVLAMEWRPEGMGLYFCKIKLNFFKHGISFQTTCVWFKSVCTTYEFTVALWGWTKMADNLASVNEHPSLSFQLYRGQWQGWAGKLWPTVTYTLTRARSSKWNYFRNCSVHLTSCRKFHHWWQMQHSGYCEIVTVEQSEIQVE